MSASVEVFKKYHNSVFIETGTQLGDGVVMALNAGFPYVISIEANLDTFHFCCDRFKQEPNVYIGHGDTKTELKNIIEGVHVQCTFWLDAHLENEYPVLEELDQIAQHPIKTHTILIDDLRMFPTDKNGLTEAKIRDRILQINPDYKFSYENGHVKNDILVAKVE